VLDQYRDLPSTYVITTTREEPAVELRHLRYFAAVAETRHFGRAAERLHMAQPALSQSIRQLESELGTPLFARTTRQVRLTPAGEFFQLEVARILESVDAATRGVRRIAAGRQGLVRIAFTGSAAHTELPRMARTVKRELPGMGLEIHADLLTPAQVDGLHDRTLDLGVLRPPMPGDGLASRTLSSEPLVLAVAEDHPLAEQASISMGDLRTERFVLFSGPDSAVNDAILRGAREVDFVPIREHEAAGISVLLPLVAADLGIALVPASVRAAPLAGVVFRDVADAPTVDLALVWRADETNPAVLAVLDALSGGGTDSPAPTAEPDEVAR
jgi:DNA-binding transcriptional LysR family regulator